VTVGSGLRYFGAAVAFGFAAVWILATLAAALVCLLAAALGYGAILAAERIRIRLDARTRKPGGKPRKKKLPLVADELNRDLGYVYEPTAPTPPHAVEPEYGWPPNDDTATSSEAR
jgi:hypothetical protein